MACVEWWSDAHPMKLVFENPGDIRTGVEQMRLGGVSDPRNGLIMKMFSLIDVGERAGTGVPDVFATMGECRTSRTTD